MGKNTVKATNLQTITMSSNSTHAWEDSKEWGDDGSDYCTSSYVVDQIVYSSSAERIISLTVIFIVLIITLVSQASVIVTILKTGSLHIPNFTVILCYCVGDLMMVISSSTSYIYHFLYYCMPRVMCRILSLTGISFAFGLASLTSLMAFERYMYLCNPMKYDRLFTHRFVVITSCVIYGFRLIYSIATEIWLGRSYHATVLACYLPGSGTNSAIQILLFILPAATITIISVLKIWRLMVSCSVGPADLPNNDITPATVNLTKQAKKAFKMVGMVSGTFWGTILPSMIFIMILFSSGFEWPDFDLRTEYGWSMSLRIVNYIFSSVSSLLNPFIYYYSRKDLRQASMKLFGIRNMIGAVDITAPSA